MGSRRNFIGSGKSVVLEPDIGEGHCTVGTGTVIVEPPEARACRAMAKGEEKDPNTSVIVVDKHGSGNCRTIGQAISMAMPGTLINVMPGIYRGSLKIKKDGLTIIGIGDVTVVSSGFGGDTIHFNADAGTIKNIKIVSKGLDPTLCAVNVIRGKLLLEGCDLTCDEAINVVRARKDSNPIMRGNRIHKSFWRGCLIEGAGVIEENHVYDFRGCGIHIVPYSTAVVRNNRILACYVGVNLEDTSKVTLERNHLFDNETGIDLTEGGKPSDKGQPHLL